MIQSLAEFNDEALALYKKLTTYPKLNGIACPSCGNEMVDIDKSVLVSNPPKKNISCPKCGHQDYRYYF